MADHIALHDKLRRVEKIIREKQWWLGDFSSGRNKRPDLEIADKREDVRILSAIAGDIRAGIARREAEGEAA